MKNNIKNRNILLYLLIGLVITTAAVWLQKQQNKQARKESKKAKITSKIISNNIPLSIVVSSQKQDAELIQNKKNLINNINNSVESNSVLNNTHINVGISQYYDHSKTAANFDLFLPLFKDDKNILFSETRLNNYFGNSNRNFEGSLYLGYRHLIPENNQLYGIYSSFDFKKMLNNKYFNQITIGTECWLNKYFLGSKIFIPTKNSETFRKKAVPGISAEIGYKFSEKTSIFLEGYYLKMAYHSNVLGVRTRIKRNLFNRGISDSCVDQVNLELGFQGDRNTGNQAFVKLDIKFGGIFSNSKTSSHVSSHMTDMISRNNTIFFIEEKPALKYEVINTYIYNINDLPLEAYKNKPLVLKDQLNNVISNNKDENIKNGYSDYVIETVEYSDKMHCYYRLDGKRISDGQNCGSTLDDAINNSNIRILQKITSGSDYEIIAQDKQYDSDSTLHQNHALTTLNFDIGLGYFRAEKTTEQKAIKQQANIKRYVFDKAGKPMVGQDGIYPGTLEEAKKHSNIVNMATNNGNIIVYIRS